MKPRAMAPSVRVVSDPWKMLASMDANTHSTIRELHDVVRPPTGKDVI